MIRFLIFVLSASFIAPVFAHHSRATFDYSKMLEFRGTVVSYKFRSPHASLVIDGIAIIDGIRQSEEAERWEFESESVAVLKMMGVGPETFRPGDTLVLRGSPHRTQGFRFGHSTQFISVNGSQFDNQNLLPNTPRAAAMDKAFAEGGVVNESAAVGIAGIAGRWLPQFEPPGTSSALPLNAEGVAAWNQYDPKLSPANTCEPMSIPGVLHAPLYLYEIIFRDKDVELYAEAYQIRRKVPLDGHPAPADPNGQFGTVVGRIKDDTLIIESSNYPVSRWGLGAAAQINGAGADVPSSAEKTVVERYSLSADGRKLIYDYTLSDPAYLSEPYQHRIEFIRVPDDTPIYSYECDVESASMFSRTPEDLPAGTDK